MARTNHKPLPPAPAPDAHDMALESAHQAWFERALGLELSDELPWEETEETARLLAEFQAATKGRTA